MNFDPFYNLENARKFHKKEKNVDLVAGCSECNKDAV